MALRWALAENETGGTLFADERLAERHVGKGAYAGMEFLHVNARTIINTVPAESRMPFRHTINPYRGCSHACVYCFARPTHDYLGLGIGTDFERKIVVKVNAVERLRAELRAPAWDGDHIAMGTNTDPYQHAEGKYHLTRGIVETLSGARNPFSILTKSTLILRDAAVLAAACERTEVGVSFSIGTLDRVGVEADRARHSPAGPPRRGPAPPDRHGHPVRRPGGARAARALRLRGAADRGGRGLRRRRGAVDLRRGAAPPRPGAGALSRLAPGGAARPRPPPPGALPARGVPGGRGAPADRGDREGGGTALRRDGPEPLPRDGRRPTAGGRRPAPATGRGRPQTAAEAGQQLRLL